MILKTDGTLWATGYNLNGQLGDGTWTNRSTPVQVMRDVKAAAAGYRHTMILKTDGTLWATGCNSDGEFGDSTATYRSTPVQINF
jgi:alpha-tubulin suppressor-like RCC1 family protein